MKILVLVSVLATAAALPSPTGVTVGIPILGQVITGVPSFVAGVFDRQFGPLPRRRPLGQRDEPPPQPSSQDDDGFLRPPQEQVEDFGPQQQEEEVEDLPQEPSKFQPDQQTQDEEEDFDYPGGGSIVSLADILKGIEKDAAAISKDKFSNTINDFAQGFYGQYLASSNRDSNLVFSPFSLHVALSMLTAGSTDNSTTQAELLNALGRFRVIQRLKSQYQALLEEYETLNSTFLIGNKIWTGPDSSIKGSFIRTLDQVFKSELGILPPGGGRPAADQINRWVERKTKGKIQKLFDSLSADVQAVLTNVIYFKDAWTVKFDAIEDPRDIPAFRTANGQSVFSGFSMMRRTSYDFGVKKVIFSEPRGAEFTLVSVPYKHDFGNRFDMVLVVPTHPEDIYKLHDALARGKGENILDRIGVELRDNLANSAEVTLTMPQFKVTGDVAVEAALKQLGVRGIFDKGEFSNISDNPLKVGKIKHKAIIEVDTEGTVGAAATGIEIVPLSAFEPTATVLVDKPFLFLIRDTLKNVPLFMGTIMDPTREQ